MTRAGQAYPSKSELSYGWSYRNVTGLRWGLEGLGLGFCGVLETARRPRGARSHEHYKNIG